MDTSAKENLLSDTIQLPNPLRSFFEPHDAYLQHRENKFFRRNANFQAYLEIQISLQR
jgi:hypothetical protein